MSLRGRLKHETRYAHARVESLVDVAKSFDSIPAYGKYVRASFAPRVRLERACIAAVDRRDSQMWAGFMVEGPMGRDLADLGVDRPHVADAPKLFADRAAATGALYVLAGSAIGANTLVSGARALGLHGEFGARHLFAQHSAARKFWAFASWLDSLALDSHQQDLCAQGALAAFEEMGASFARPVPPARHA